MAKLEWRPSSLAIMVSGIDQSDDKDIVITVIKRSLSLR